MKKIFYLVFFISLCFLFNIEINAEDAEEIDCESHPYACVKCTYAIPHGDKITFLTYSDGKNLVFNVLEIKKDTTTGDISYGKITAEDFKFDTDKLTCPTYIYYSSYNNSTNLSKTDYEFYFNGSGSKGFVEDKVFNNKTIDGQTYEEESDNPYIDSKKFKQLLGALRKPLGILAEQALSYPITIDGSESNLNAIDANDNICSNCSSDPLGYTEQGIKDVMEYCNILYEKYPSYKNNQDMQKRMDECSSFNKFYERLVNEKIIADLSQGCEIFSTQLKEKLVWILNIIKIAGPLLALGLGTLDFIKVLANGDADKEMKTAFKRFSIRLGAAALLFIIPLILAFLLDMFLGNQDGYNSDNPFCVEIDWDE